MSKRVSWSLYSKRRRITVQSLMASGRITGFESYVSYCDKFSVQPLTEAEFSSNIQPAPSLQQIISTISVTESTASDPPAEVQTAEASMPRADDREIRLTSSVPDEPVTSNISDEPQQIPLVATVWLAGVSDDAQSASGVTSLIPQRQEDIRYKKKKKNKG